MGRVNLLLVDGYTDSNIDMRGYLENLGCDIVTAGSGNEVMSLIGEYDFALILIDTQLPGMDSFEVAERIRSSTMTNHIPILFLAGINSDQKYIFKGYEAGAVDYILKPIEPVILENKVKVFIELYKQRMAVETALEKIKISEEKYKNLFDTSRDGIAFMSMEGYIENANPAFCEMLGYSLNELRFLTYHQVTPEKWALLDSEIVESQVLTRGYSDEFNKEFIRKDNTIIPIRIRVWLVRDNKGHPLRLLTIVRNMVKQKQLEAQLRQSQKMESIGTLAGGIAHDFNNILGAIMGYAQLAQLDVPREGPAKKNIDNVLTACNRAKDLISHILLFSRQTEKVRKPVRVHSVVLEALKLIRASLPSTIEIEQDIAKEDTVVFTDPTEIHQVIMNFSTNALHAMDEKGGTLRISVKPVELDKMGPVGKRGVKSGPYLKLSISDTGVGIEPAIIERIFDPYFTTKKKDAGTGLGLAVVHGIIENHNGFINVESEPGKGTVFDVFLPRIKSEGMQGVKRKEKILTGSERILFVDDEQSLADLEKVMLQRLGYSVVSQSSSTNALKIFEAGPEKFDLVITDMTMPKMTGEELSRRILAIRPDIPVIICTGYSHQITHEKAHEIGIKELLYKPVEIRELASVIRRVLEKG